MTSVDYHTIPDIERGTLSAMTYSEVLHCSAHCNDDLWFHPNAVTLALQPLEKKRIHGTRKHHNSIDRSELDMGYRKKPNFTDIDNLQNATETYYERQRKELGKSFQIAYIWDVFARYIVIGIAVVAFLAGLLTGWLIFGGSSGGGNNNAFSAEATSEAEQEPEDEPPEEQVPPADAEDSEDDDNAVQTTAPADDDPADVEDDTEETTTCTTAPDDEDDDEPDVTTVKTTAGTTRRGETTARPVYTQAPSYNPVTPPVNTTRAPARTTARTTARPATRTTVKTTAKPAPTTTVTTAKPPVDTSKRNLGVTVNRKTAVLSGSTWLCTFNITLTNNRSVAMSTQQAKLSVPSGCKLESVVVGGKASLNGTALTITNSTSLAPGQSKTITFTLSSGTKLVPSDLVVR